MASSASRRLIVLGSGTSTGVPVLGCDCAVCSSTNPRNKRTRSSVLLHLPAGVLLVDTSPEMRLQLLAAKVPFAHAIFYTHAHADHLFGLDDARLFPKHLGGPVPVLCEEEVEEAVRRVFHYAFSDRASQIPTGGVPRLEFRRVRPGESFEILGETFHPFRLEHGRFNVLGFRVRDIAYCTDVSRIPVESEPWLSGLDTLILDALRIEPHPTHFSLAEALREIERFAPRRAYLTHLSHVFDHETFEAALPRHVRLAYDGLALDF